MSKESRWTDLTIGDGVIANPKKKMKKKAIVLALLSTIIGYTAHADSEERTNLKQIKSIVVLSLDTINGYQSRYAYPDENLND